MSYIEDLTQVLSYVAAFGCVVMSIPSILIGAIASVTGESCHIYRGSYTGTIVCCCIWVCSDVNPLHIDRCYCFCHR